jgi:hypothetical protein
MAIPSNYLGIGAAISLFLFPVLTIVIAVVLLMLRKAD